MPTQICFGMNCTLEITGLIQMMSTSNPGRKNIKPPPPSVGTQLTWTTNVLARISSRQKTRTDTFIAMMARAVVQRYFNPKITTPFLNLLPKKNQVISSRPIKCRQIKMQLKEEGELLLASFESVEQAFEWCQSATLLRTYFYSAFDRIDNDMCFISTCSSGGQVGSVVNGKRTRKGELYLTSKCGPDRILDLQLDIDYNNNTVKWSFIDGTITETTPLPPQRPLYMIYSTGYSHSGARFLTPFFKKVDS